MKVSEAIGQLKMFPKDAEVTALSVQLVGGARTVAVGTMMMLLENDGRGMGATYKAIWDGSTWLRADSPAGRELVDRTVKQLFAAYSDRPGND